MGLKDLLFWKEKPAGLCHMLQCIKNLTHKSAEQQTYFVLSSLVHDCFIFTDLPQHLKPRTGEVNNTLGSNEWVSSWRRGIKIVFKKKRKVKRMGKNDPKKYNMVMVIRSWSPEAHCCACDTNANKFGLNQKHLKHKLLKK